MSLILEDQDFALYLGDAVTVVAEMPDRVAAACVTSPPYLDARPEYGSPSIEQFDVLFVELARVLTDCVLLNVGRLFRQGIEQLWWLELLGSANRAGWSLLDTFVWAKPNANPIRGQVFTDSHEYVLVLGRPGDRLNEDAIRTPYASASIARMARPWRNGRGTKLDLRHEDQPSRALNPLGARARSYLEIVVGTEKGNPHPAPMALALAEHLVLLASFPGQTILDPFLGSGTTALAARKHGRCSIGVELDPQYAALAARRLNQQSLFAEGAA